MRKARIVAQRDAAWLAVGAGPRENRRRLTLRGRSRESVRRDRAGRLARRGQRLFQFAQLVAIAVRRVAGTREFFLRRHPSWDAQLNRYPIVRVAEAPIPAEEARAAKPVP